MKLGLLITSILPLLNFDFALLYLAFDLGLEIDETIDKILCYPHLGAAQWICFSTPLGQRRQNTWEKRQNIWEKEINYMGKGDKIHVKRDKIHEKNRQNI